MLHQERYGSGPDTAVFLHGFLGRGRNLERLVRRFLARKSDFHAVTLDLPGHGSSPPLAPDEDIATVAETILEEMADTGSLRVIGHSLGGRVALGMLALDPARVERVDLLDITPGPIDQLPVGHVLAELCEAPERVARRDDMLAHLVEQRGLSVGLSRWMMMNLKADPGGGFVWAVDRAALAAFHKRHQRSNLWAPVEAYPERIRVVRGSLSPYIPEADAARLRQIGVAVTELPGVGHFVHTDGLDASTEVITGA